MCLLAVESIGLHSITLSIFYLQRLVKDTRSMIRHAKLAFRLKKRLISRARINDMLKGPHLHNDGIINGFIDTDWSPVHFHAFKCSMIFKVRIL